MKYIKYYYKLNEAKKLKPVPVVYLGEETQDIDAKFLDKYKYVFLIEFHSSDDRIFSSNGSCGNRSRFWPLWKVSWPTSFGKRVDVLGTLPKASL